MNLLGYRFKQINITPDKLNACHRKATKKLEFKLIIFQTNDERKAATVLQRH